MARIKEISRTNKRRATKGIILVVCEGRNETEYNYLNNFRSRYAKMNLHIHKSEATDPINMIKTLKRYMQRYDMDFSEGDRAYCLIDIDVDEKRAGLIKELERKERKVVFIRSNACFEVWFLLHFIDNPKQQNSSQNVKKELKKYISNYSENLDVYNVVAEVRNNLDTAIKRAENIRSNHVRNGADIKTEEANPYTDMDVLMTVLIDNLKE